jgi:hypothetical protein
MRRRSRKLVWNLLIWKILKLTLITTMSELETSRYLPTNRDACASRKHPVMRCLSAEELRNRERWCHRLSRGAALTSFTAVIVLVALQSSARCAPPSLLEYVLFYLFVLGCGGVVARLLVPSLRPGWYRPLDYRYREQLDRLYAANHQLSLYCDEVQRQKRGVTKGEFVKMRRWVARHSKPNAQNFS